MKESKTAREWFEQAKSDGREWADEAMREHDNNPEYVKRTRFYFFASLRSALFFGFDWRIASAGYDFWEKIYDDLVKPLS